MTRHLCPAVILTGLSVAAGADALRAAANATQPVATATASERDDGICVASVVPFSPRVRASSAVVSENVSGTVTRFVTGKSSRLSQIAWQIADFWFRNVPEHASMGEWRRRPRNAPRSARSPTWRASRSRRSRAFSTAADDVSDETRDLVSRVIREHGYTANRSARGLSGRPHRARRRPRPARLPRVLLRHPRRRGRGAVRAGHADRALADQARARPRGLAARPAARRDRRRADRPPRGVERGARAAPRQRLSVRRRRPADAARRAHPLGLGRAHVGRRPGDAPPARARASADRAITGPRGWVATEDRRRGYRAALASAGILPDPALEVESIPRSTPGERPPPLCSTCPTRRRRSSRSTTTSRSARSRRRARAACACRTISRSSASTTSSTRRS